jgi:threonine synthase
MQFTSTRDDAHRASLATALTDGLAPDGGLYVPTTFPTLALEAFDGQERIEAIAETLLRPFFDGDRLENDLAAICQETFDFPVPLRDLSDHTAVLELFHGPTAAFKDVGARFLASGLSRLNQGADAPVTILVATSGDTGAAVAAAFHQKPHVEVIVLYPKGRVSARQEKQLTGWGGNVLTVAVQGVFDDCQQLVKAAFQDDWWQHHRRLSSANSINLGRLLPQMTYYAAAGLWYQRRHGVQPGFIVPSGNLGNALAALYARACGLPIGEIVMATNANRPVTHYLDTGTWKPFDTQETLATAMDVGDPSNMERLRYHWDDMSSLRSAVRAMRVSDEAIRRQIRRGPAAWGQVWDPHTATAVEVREQIDPEERQPWIIVATAHPAKFEHVVEPLIGETVPVPEALAAVMDRAAPAPEITPSLDALRDVVRTHEAQRPATPHNP